MENKKLSKLTIVLEEIEHPKKGRGCMVTAEGKADNASLAKMFATMFEAFEKKYPLAMAAAFAIYFGVDPEELEN